MSVLHPWALDPSSLRQRLPDDPLRLSSRPGRRRGALELEACGRLDVCACVCVRARMRVRVLLLLLCVRARAYACVHAHRDQRGLLSSHTQG